jgi:hypothetical protein
MNKIEDYMNRCTDMDRGWWPVVHLRPAKDKDIDNTVLLKITPIFGTLAAILLILTRLPMTIISMLIYLLSCWIGFFFVYKFTFALTWNRRAARLRESNRNNI